MSKIFNWLLRSKDDRLSRLHSRNDNFINSRFPFVNLTKSIITYILNRFNVNFNIPWISWDATADIKRYIGKCNDVRVLEFGSGRSTVWFLKNGCEITSIEHSKEWFDIVKRTIESKNYKNYNYIYAEEDRAYIKPNILGLFDIILIDGRCRYQSFLNNIDRLKAGGILYIDNTDANSSDGEDGEIKNLCNKVDEYVKNNNLIIKKYVDFSPSSLFVTEGILVINEKSN